MKRKKLVKIVLVVTLAVVMLPAAIYAAPAITTISGSVVHGGTITIGGSGFGTKATAAPALFDRAEGTWGSLSNGQAIPIETSPWIGDSVSNYNTTSGEQRSTRSTANYKTSSSAYNFLDGYLFSSNPPQIYVAWWMQVSSSNIGGSEKWLRLGVGGQGDSVLTSNTSSWSGEVTMAITGGANYCIPNPPGNGTLQHWDGTVLTANTWHFMEGYFDKTNHWWNYFVDGHSITGGNISYSGCDTSGFNYVWKVGHDTDNGWYPTSWVDDIYIDNTFQHVVICNASTYSSSTHCEIQPPTAWAIGTINVTVNQGSFANGATAYLYVIDANGNASTGAQITFGSAIVRPKDPSPLY